jgi:hypothetical protein
MYQGWNDNGCHSQEWVQNTNAFLERDFSAVPNSENFVVCVHVQIVAIELERVELS